MGLLDDLQMGFGLKERTEDYDARTARTIAANEAAGGSNDAMRLAQARNPQHSSFLPVSAAAAHSNTLEAEDTTKATRRKSRKMIARLCSAYSLAQKAT